MNDLVQTLQVWEYDPSSALDVNCPPVFNGVYFKDEPEVLASLLDISQNKTNDVLAVLRLLATAMLKVTTRQLQEYLPGGSFHACNDVILREKLSHSLLTNLVAEQSFADLDFSLFKRRSASLHHHTTICMLKKNKSISDWLLQQDEEERNRLLTIASKKGQDLRVKHQQMQVDALREIEAGMEEKRREKEEKAERKRANEDKIMEEIRSHNGPMKSVSDVECFVSRFSTMGKTKSALRAEILFLKLILKRKSPLLIVSGRPVELFNRLRKYFGADNDIPLPPFQPS